jgi:hypothetical protein
MNTIREAEKNLATQRARERGGARLKFLITAAVIALLGYSAYQYVPIAIHAYQYKDFMQQTVDRATFGKSIEWVQEQLKAGSSDYDVPPDAVINVVQRDGRIEAHVQFTRPIPLPGYVYQYDFDNTVRSSQFLSSK